MDQAQKKRLFDGGVKRIMNRSLKRRRINRRAFALAEQVKKEWYQEGARGKEWGPYQKYPEVERAANFEFIRQYLLKRLKRE